MAYARKRSELRNSNIDDKLYIIMINPIKRSYAAKRIKFEDIPSLNKNTSVLRIVPYSKGNNLVYLSSSAYKDHDIREVHENFANKLERRIGETRVIAPMSLRDLRLGTVFG
jgi:hypothetical protein